MTNVTLPLGQRPILIPVADGWFYADSEASGFVRNGRFMEVQLPGEVSAATFDGAQTYVALHNPHGAGVRAEAIGIVRDAFEERVRLKNYGFAASQGRAPVLSLIAADDAFVFSACLAKDPQHKGWAVHRISAAGALEKSFELIAARHSASADQLVRPGILAYQDQLLAQQAGSLLALDLMLTLVDPPPVEWNSGPFACFEASLAWADGRWDARGQRPVTSIRVYDPKRVYEFEVERLPNLIALGPSAVVWTVGRGLFLRTSSGRTTKLRAGGKVEKLQFRSGKLFGLVRSTSKRFLKSFSERT